MKNYHTDPLDATKLRRNKTSMNAWLAIKNKKNPITLESAEVPTIHPCAHSKYFFFHQNFITNIYLCPCWCVAWIQVGSVPVEFQQGEPGDRFYWLFSLSDRVLSRSVMWRQFQNRWTELELTAVYAAETTANWATVNKADIWVMMQIRDSPVRSCMLYNTLCYAILEISSLVCGIIIFIAGADLDTFFF